jgi:hypothetical protein
MLSDSCILFVTFFARVMQSVNPLSADPECAQFAALIVKQCNLDSNCGFSNSQIRRLRNSHRGLDLWGQLGRSRDSQKFDLTRFCKEACSDEFLRARTCFKTAKSENPSADPRQVCFWEVADLCKRIEFTWTDIVSRANS